jgi:hypothetical protein
MTNEKNFWKFLPIGSWISYNKKTKKYNEDYLQNKINPTALEQLKHTALESFHTIYAMIGIGAAELSLAYLASGIFFGNWNPHKLEEHNKNLEQKIKTQYETPIDSTYTNLFQDTINKNY